MSRRTIDPKEEPNWFLDEDGNEVCDNDSDDEQLAHVEDLNRSSFHRRTKKATARRAKAESSESH
jgi:hypothetical protein